MATVLYLIMIPWFALITLVRIELMAPMLLIITLFGAYANERNIMDAGRQHEAFLLLVSRAEAAGLLYSRRTRVDGRSALHPCLERSLDQSRCVCQGRF